MLPGRRVQNSETTMSKTIPGEFSNEEAKVSHGDEESDIMQVIIGDALDRDSFYPNHQMKRIVIEEEDKVDLTFTSDQENEYGSSFATHPLTSSKLKSTLSVSQKLPDAPYKEVPLIMKKSDTLEIPKRDKQKNYIEEAKKTHRGRITQSFIAMKKQGHIYNEEDLWGIIEHHKKISAKIEEQRSYILQLEISPPKRSTGTTLKKFYKSLDFYVQKKKRLVDY